MNEDFRLSEIFQILKSPARTRSKNQVESLVKFTQDVNFFKKITSEHKSAEIHRECCSVMTLEEYELADVVINFGEKAEKFYIILDGSVSVMVPIKKKIKLTLQEFHHYEDLCKQETNSISSGSSISSNSIDSHSNHHPLRSQRQKRVAIINVKEILENFKEEDNSLKHSNTNPLIENEEKIISKLFREKLSKEKKEILKVIKEANKEFIEIEIDKMEEVDVLSPGDSFGELALISERPRAASVIAKGHLSLLVLKKTQFKAILGAISEKKVSLKVKQLKNFPYFASWSKNALSRLTFYFRLSQISHNQALFTQGERVNGIFFIVEGEFILTKKVESRDSQPYVFQSDLDQQNVKKIKSIKITKEKKIIIKGKNESIGGYEIFNNLSFRQFSCSCNSTTAEVFFISKEQFLSKVPNIESIRSIIHTENMRLEERFQKICEFDKSSLANKIFQSHSGKKNVYFNPKLDSSFLKHSRKIDESWTSGKSLTIRTESSLKRSSFKDAFRKLTQTEISEAVNGRSLTVKKKSKALKTFIQKRAPPKSFLREFRKKLLKPSDS